MQLRSRLYPVEFRLWDVTRLTAADLIEIPKVIEMSLAPNQRAQENSTEVLEIILDEDGGMIGRTMQCSPSPTDRLGRSG